MRNDNLGYGSGDIFGAAWEASIVQAALDEKRAEALAATTDSVRVLMNLHHDTAASIKSNSEYSESGKNSRLAALVAQSDTRLSNMTKATLADLKETTVRLSNSLANASNKELDVQGMLRAIEVRAIAAEMDPLDCEMQCKQLAAFGGDDASVMAVLGASALQPLLRPEVAADVAAMLGARNLPDEAEALRQARKSLAILENAIGTATHSFATPAYRATLATDPLALSASAPSIPRSDAPGA